MRSNTVRSASLALAVLACTSEQTPTESSTSASLARAATRTYTAVDLGTLGGGVASARDINSRGQVVGWSSTEVGETSAFLWEKGVMTNIGFFDFSEATGINSRGDVVGNFGQGGGLGAFLWLNGVIHRLDPLEPDAFIQVADINSRRQVVGFSAGSAVLWENGILTDLGTLGGIFQATAINQKGQVVGLSQTANGEIHAFLLSNGSMTDLGTLGGELSHAEDINSRGQVVGSSQTAAGETHAFLWEKGVMTDLGTLGGNLSVATGINSRGEVVGYSLTADGKTHAFHWNRGAMTDLGTLGGDFSRAEAINSRGQVVGQSTTEGGEGHATLWTRQSPQKGVDVAIGANNDGGE